MHPLVGLAFGLLGLSGFVAAQINWSRYQAERQRHERTIRHARTRRALSDNGPGLP